MPWTETRPMQRLDFIRASQTGTMSFSALCRLFGISRKMGYKWLGRFEPSEPATLFDRSRAPHSHSRTIPPDIAAHLMALRQKHPDWGPKKLRMWLLNHQVDFPVPAASTIGDILKRQGLVPDRKRKHRTPGNRQPLTTVQDINQVWSADFKGKFRLLSREYCHPFTLTDNHSRYLLSCRGNHHENTAFARQCLTDAFLEYGLPDVLRTDNGQPFAGVGVAGLSRLSVWLIKLGVRPERIRKGHPEENGRHERMHRSLKSALKHGNIFRTQEEQQAWFSHYREEFNQERPHEALGGSTPGQVWRPSSRRWDGKVPEYE
ncbi:TPA: transposase, partial [Kluyvera ascorbata]|nr:transposase [Kluyvera ascorbata]